LMHSPSSQNRTSIRWLQLFGPEKNPEAIFSRGIVCSAAKRTLGKDLDILHPRHMAASDTRSTLKFTKMCKYWSSNRCTMGDACNFAHSDTELREQPDLVATKLCFQFMSKGRCNKGASCTFAHGKKELRQMPAGGDGQRKPNFEPMKINTQMAKEVNSLAMHLPMSPLTPMSPQLGVPSMPPTTAGPPTAASATPSVQSQMKAVQSKLEQLVLTSGANSLAPPFRPPPGLAPPPSPVSICSPMSPLSPKTPGGGYRSRGSAWASPVMEDDVDSIVNFSYPMDNTMPASVLKGKDFEAHSLASTAFPLSLQKLSALDVCDSEPVSPKSEIVWL